MVFETGCGAITAHRVELSMPAQSDGSRPLRTTVVVVSVLYDLCARKDNNEWGRKTSHCAFICNYVNERREDAMPFRFLPKGRSHSGRYTSCEPLITGHL